MGYTVAGHDRSIDAIDIDHAAPVIQGHVNTPKVSVFRQHPLRYSLELSIGPSTDQFLREINMHFLGSAFCACSDTAETPVMTPTNPTPTVAEKAFLVGDPIA